MAYAYSPLSEEINKTAYLCVTRGCGEDLGYKKRKYCDNCFSKSGREVIENENDILNRKVEA